MGVAEPSAYPIKIFTVHGGPKGRLEPSEAFKLTIETELNEMHRAKILAIWL